jgi:type IV pilus assembly protein PilX
MLRQTTTLARLGAQRGVTMLVVLILMTVMLLGGLALARVSEVGALAFGNVASRDSAMQASEVGVSVAFTALKALANDDNDVAGWYWSTYQATDLMGLPTTANWAAAPTQAVGRYTVGYVAERMCNTTPVTDQLHQCLVRMVPQMASHVAGSEPPDPPSAKQFRVTVRATETAGATGKGAQSMVQSLVTKG